MSNNLGAIPALIIFIFGIWFAIPNEAGLGVIIMKGIEQAMCPGNIICDSVGSYIIVLIVIGILMFLSSGYYIYLQFKEGNLF